jgi:hypothetical protein
MSAGNDATRKEYSLDKGDPLYDHLVIYAVGLIALVSLHHEPIRKQISALPEILMDGTVEKNVHVPLEPFRAWIENLDKAANQEYLVRLTVWIAEKVLAASYEEVIKSKKDNSDIIEFYRHIRNGVSHGNKFDIEISKKVQKKKGITDRTVLATWRGKNITLSLNGSAVMPTFLTPGDVFLLMFDTNSHLKSGASKV